MMKQEEMIIESARHHPTTENSGIPRNLLTHLGIVWFSLGRDDFSAPIR